VKTTAVILMMIQMGHGVSLLMGVHSSVHGITVLQMNQLNLQQLVDLARQQLLPLQPQRLLNLNVQIVHIILSTSP